MTDPTASNGAEESPRRRTGSATAELAAYTICHKSQDLAGRKVVEGFAIDSADPDSPMDRDDAVRIRFHDDPHKGRLATLDVSIADVADAVPRAAEREPDTRLAELDRYACRNGESLYFSHGVSPMLPRRMQDRLSLENGKERAAVTISVTMDAQCNIVHTEFARTRLKAKCRSYRDAAADIMITGHPIQQLSVVANQLLKRKSGITELPKYDEITGMYTDHEGGTRHISRDELSAFKTVQGCMIAGNEAAANLMSSCNFLFRNHSHVLRNGGGDIFFYRKRDEVEHMSRAGGRIEQSKAEYNETCRGHYGLDAEKYCHVTSPMRRYADLANQRMMHWAIDVVDAITDSAVSDPAHNASFLPRDRIAYLVWDRAQELLGKASSFKEANRTQHKMREKQLEEGIAEALMPVTGGDKVRAGRIAKVAVNAIDGVELPYTRKQMAAVAQHLNQTLAKNRNARRDSQFSETEAWLNAVFPAPEEKMLRAWGAVSFARLLAAAARRGDNHEIFAREVASRFTEDKETLVQNLYTVLVIAERHKDSHWKELKRIAFQMIKDDPALGEKVFAFMQSQHDAPKTYVIESTLFDSRKNRYPSACIVLSHHDTDYAAPIIDTADTPEKARQGAILSFFRHYGNLHYHNDLYTPTMIDLALKIAKAKRLERYALLKTVCGEHLTVEEVLQPVPVDANMMEVTLKVSAKDGSQVLTKSSLSGVTNTAHILDKLAKNMLKDGRFIDLLSQYHQVADLEAGEAGTHAQSSTPIVWTDAECLRGAIDRIGSTQRH
jgi:hypothetical protein